MSPVEWQRVLAAEAAAERELRAVPDWLWDGETAPVPVEVLADSHYGLMVDDHADLAGLAGVEVAGAPLSGVLLPASREIWLNAHEAARAPARRRFTVGHELGHWVLHCQRGPAAAGAAVHCRGSEVREEAAAVKSLDYPPEELDANQFAAALLMPADLVRIEHARLGGDEDRLCEAFDVSRPAMQRRLWFLTAISGTARR